MVKSDGVSETSVAEEAGGTDQDEEPMTHFRVMQLKNGKPVFAADVKGLAKIARIRKEMPGLSFGDYSTHVDVKGKTGIPFWVTSTPWDGKAAGDFGQRNPAPDGRYAQTLVKEIPGFVEVEAVRAFLETLDDRRVHRCYVGNADATRSVLRRVAWSFGMRAAFLKGDLKDDVHARVATLWDEHQKRTLLLVDSW